MSDKIGEAARSAVDKIYSRFRADSSRSERPGLTETIEQAIRETFSGVGGCLAACRSAVAALIESRVSAAEHRFEQASETSVARGVALDQIADGEIPHSDDDLCISNAGRYVVGVEDRVRQARKGALAAVCCGYCAAKYLHLDPTPIFQDKERLWVHKPTLRGYSDAVCSAQLIRALAASEPKEQRPASARTTMPPRDRVPILL